jgi:hypothetical protein
LCEIERKHGYQHNSGFHNFQFHAGPSRFEETETDSFLLAGLPKTLLNGTGSWKTHVSMANSKGEMLPDGLDIDFVHKSFHGNTNMNKFKLIAYELSDPWLQIVHIFKS